LLLCIRNVDGAGDAVDVTAHNLIVPYEFDLGRIAHTKRSEVCFLKYPSIQKELADAVPSSDAAGLSKT
jgi:hypothetical protein